MAFWRPLRHLLALIVLCGNWGFGHAAGDPELGKRIYRDGVLPSGKPLTAVLHGTIPLRSKDAACSTCHRRSGFGTSEGRMVIRPITGKYLYTPAEPPPRQLLSDPSQSPRTRPAYDDASLLRAIREGIDSSQRQIDGPMPRYPLSEADGQHLVAYLKTLSTESSPGVNDTEIHLATVIHRGVSAERQEAIRATMDAFLRIKNANTRGELTKRPVKGSWAMARMYKAYRAWRLHYWYVDGPEETWAQQLEAQYRQQPVFALIGGVSAAGWRPVHDFCAGNGIPCLFPIVSLPPQETDFYSIYLSRGLGLEAAALGSFLGQEGHRGPLLQVFREGSQGAAAAKLFRAVVPSDGPLKDQAVAPGVTLDAAYLRDLLRRERPHGLVFWLETADLVALRDIEVELLPPRIYLSGTLADIAVLSTLPAALRERIRLTYPDELPQRQPRQLARSLIWLKAQGIPPNHLRDQIDTLFALSQAGEGITHIEINFSREYLVERIEHGLERALTPSSYPRVSLGPDQRFAAKGCHIVKLTDTPHQLEPVEGGWIVP